MTVHGGAARVGSAVHYVSFGTPGGEYTSQCRSATVTEVGAGGAVGLAVLNPTGLFFHPLAAGGGCPFDADHNEVDPLGKGGSWHWPERAG